MTIVGVAWLNSIGSGSTTSISLRASPTSIDGSSRTAAGPGLHPDALAALARVVQLELVILGDDLLGHQTRTSLGGRRRGRLGGLSPALQEFERHVVAPRRVRAG